MNQVCIHEGVIICVKTREQKDPYKNHLLRHGVVAFISFLYLGERGKEETVNHLFYDVFSSIVYEDQYLLQI